MPRLDTTILQVTKPTIKLDDVIVFDSENVKYIGSYFPFIVINNFEFSIENIKSFKFEVNSFLPRIYITLSDNSANFLSRYFPKDGDIMSFYIKANNEKVFKPIGIDFNILEITPVSSNNFTRKAPMFTIYGEMKVPFLLTEFNEVFPNMSSFETLLEVSQSLDLGFASNDDTTDDVMTWINPYDTRIKFINDVVSHSYKDDDSFFTCFIDSYYTLNFVNVNKLFTINTDIIESEVYSIQLPELITDDSNLTKGNKSPLILSNHEEFKGTSKYISNYSMFNNTGKISLINGYKRYCQYYDISTNEFISEYVDPLTTDGTDTYIHMKGRYIYNGSEFIPEGIADKHVKYKYMGKQDSRDNGNCHENYMYANIQNYQNSKEIFKMGLKVSLDIADMTLTRYQVIPIYIFNNEEVSKQIENNSNDLNREPILNDFLSGNYVISDISYTYKYPGPIKQELTLLKREFKPVK